MIEYVEGPRGCTYLLYKNQLYTKCTNKEFWKCRNKDCNLIIRLVNDEITKETSHPMHGEVTMVEIECLKVIKKMKVEACNDLNVDIKIIYDRNIKLLTDKKISIQDISDYIRPYSAMRSTLNKCREKVKPKLPKTIEELEVTGDYRLTNEHLPFLCYDNNDSKNRIIIFMSSFASEWLREN